jgi:hypothetical protein
MASEREEAFARRSCPASRSWRLHRCNNITDDYDLARHSTVGDSIDAAIERAQQHRYYDTATWYYNATTQLSVTLKDINHSRQTCEMQGLTIQ